MKNEVMKFVSSLEAKELNGQQASLLFQGEDLEMGGVFNGVCTDGKNSPCSNGSCGNSSNPEGCSNILCEGSNNKTSCGTGGGGGTGGTGGGSGANRMAMPGFPGFEL